MQIKFKLPSFKAFHLNSLKYIYGLIAVVVIGIFGVIGMFLYQNFYLAIAQTEEIILLRREVAPDVLHIESVEDVIGKLKIKISPSQQQDINLVNNPFRTIQVEQNFQNID
jgi:hypothetical protein